MPRYSQPRTLRWRRWLWIGLAITGLALAIAVGRQIVHVAKVKLLERHDAGFVRMQHQINDVLQRELNTLTAEVKSTRAQAGSSALLNSDRLTLDHTPIGSAGSYPGQSPLVRAERVSYWQAALIGASSGIVTVVVFLLAYLAPRFRRRPTNFRTGASLSSDSLVAANIAREQQNASALSAAVARLEEVYRDLHAFLECQEGALTINRSAEAPEDREPASPGKVTLPRFDRSAERFSSAAPRRRGTGVSVSYTEEATIEKSPSPAPEVTLGDLYVTLCSRSSGTRFQDDLLEQLQERHLPASISPVFRDGARESNMFMEEQGGLGNVTISLRVEIDGEFFLVPRPEKDKNFTDTTGFETNSSSRLGCTTDKLRQMKPARLARAAANAWQVSEQGLLDFAA